MIEYQTLDPHIRLGELPQFPPVPGSARSWRDPYVNNVKLDMVFPLFVNSYVAQEMRHDA